MKIWCFFVRKLVFYTGTSFAKLSIFIVTFLIAKQPIRFHRFFSFDRMKKKKFSRWTWQQVLDFSSKTKSSESEEERDWNAWPMACRLLIGGAVRPEDWRRDSMVLAEEWGRTRTRVWSKTKPVRPRLDFRRRQTPFLFASGTGGAPPWQQVEPQCNLKLPKLLRKPSRREAGRDSCFS